MLGFYRDWLYGGELYLIVVVFFALTALSKRIPPFVTLLAIALAIFSAPPLPLWLAALLLMMALPHVVRPQRRLFAVAAIAASLIAFGLEVPYVFGRPHIPKPAHLFVIGDSISSGGFTERMPWPAVLQSMSGVPVTNLALASADAKMALDREPLPRPANDNECVLVEIGENDMLDGVPLAPFESAFDRLLENAARGRRVLVLDLPVLPGRWGYAAIVRRLARKHGCTIIPKRLLVDAQTSNTSDGAHLTQKGHDAFARSLCDWLRWRADVSSATTGRLGRSD